MIHALAYLKSEIRINSKRPIFKYASIIKHEIAEKYKSPNVLYEKIKFLNESENDSLISKEKFKNWLNEEDIDYNQETLEENWEYIENDILSEIGSSLWGKNMNYKIKSLKDAQILEAIKNLRNK